jgi:HK97 family phage portal protein
MNPITKIKSFFSQKSNVRDIDITDPNAAFIYGVSDGRPMLITPKMAYYMEDKSSDLGKAVTDIAIDIANLEKGVKTKGNKDIDYDHPMMQYLNNPRGDMNAGQFWFHIAESFLLLEEFYIVARGNINNPPLELVFIRPYDISITMDNTVGDPSSIQTTSVKDKRNYERQIIAGRVRYISKDTLNELIPVRGIISIIDEWRGRSPLVRLFYDVAMNTDGKRHNVSLLKNGMRTTGVLSPKGGKDGLNAASWDQKKVTQIEERIRAFNQGAANAGSVLIIGAPTELQGLQQSNKDMDFLSLLTNSKESIYNLYSYPLPLVSTETMTLDNYTIAGERYYTEAVFPTFKRIADGLIDALGFRFGLTPQQTLMYAPASIEVLQKAAMRNMTSATATEVLEVNEIRQIGGYEELDDGKVVLISGSKVPLDMVASGGLDFPPTTDEEDDIIEEGTNVITGDSASPSEEG